MPIYKLENGTIANADQVMANTNIALKVNIVSSLNNIKSTLSAGYTLSSQTQFVYDLFDTDTGSTSNFDYNATSDRYEAGIGSNTPAILETAIETITIGSYSACNVEIGSFNSNNSLAIYGSLNDGSDWTLMSDGDLTSLGYGSELKFKYELTRSDTTETEYIREYGAYYG